MTYRDYQIAQEIEQQGYPFSVTPIGGRDDDTES